MFGRLKRLFGEDRTEDPLPPWADFFESAAQARRFEAAVAAYFASKGADVIVAGGLVRRADLPNAVSEHGLSNVGQICASADESDWPSIIAHHFGILERVVESDDAAAPSGSTYDAFAERLVIRLWEAGDLAKVAPNTVGRPEIPGLLSVLSIDLPEAVRMVTSGEVGRWEVSEDELFRIAGENVARLSPVESQPLDVGDGLTIRGYTGESFFVASLARHPEQLEGAIGRHGAFLAMPVRNTILAVPFDGLDAIKAVGPLVAMCCAAARRGPGTVSSRIWWYRAGRWMEIPYRLPSKRDEALGIMPPDEFVQFLNTLAES